jgi:soluble lytic murein transglycosylase
MSKHDGDIQVSPFVVRPTEMFRYILSGLIIAAVLAATGSYFFREYWEHRFDELITQQARIYRIDEKLIWSLIYEETYFRSSSVGDAEEVGLMQVTPLVARDWAKETGLSEFERQSVENVYELLSDPKRNLQIGCWYYEKLRERYRGRPAETAMTLAAYNAGPSRVEEWTRDVEAATLSETAFIERIGIPSTRAYVSSILNRYRSVTSPSPQ